MDTVNTRQQVLQTVFLVDVTTAVAEVFSTSKLLPIAAGCVADSPDIHTRRPYWVDE